MVDPAVAPAARAMLPLPGDFRPGWATSRVEPEPPAPQLAPPPEPPVEEPVAAAAEPPAPLPRRRRGRRAARVLVLGAAAAGVFALGYVVGDRSTSSGAEVAARTDPPTQTDTSDVHGPLRKPATTAVAPSTTTEQAPPRRTATAPRRAATASAPTTRRQTTTVATRRPAATRPARSTTRRATTTTTAAKPKRKPPAGSGFVPARTWTWAPVAGATAYRVTFTRDASPFYRATTREPRLDLPARVKFVPGRYTWSVVPVVNGRPAAEVVRSSFTVG